MNIQFKNSQSVVIVLMLAMAGLSTYAQTNLSKARLAIVVEDSSIAGAGDMLTVELSKRDDLELLERAQILKIYREQALSGGNKDHLRLARILGADGLLLLEKFNEGPDQYLALRIVAVKPAVLLTCERFPWPVTNLSQWTSGISRHLAPYVPKLAVLGEEALPISIVSIRSAVQSEEAREIERELTLLAIERFSREKQVFVLERRQMAVLSAENELKGLDDSQFWNGRYLLEGTVDRDVYSTATITLNARLIPPNGGKPREIISSGSRTNLGGIINQLTAKVLADLKVTFGGKPWDSSAEAEQYLSDAQWAYHWGLLAQAETASESAWALGKHTPEVAALRIDAYANDGCPAPGESTGNLIVPAVPEAKKLRPLQRALELFQQGVAMFFTNGTPLDEEWFKRGARILRGSAGVLEGFYYAAELRSGNEEDLAHARLLMRQTLALVDTRMPPEWISNRPSAKNVIHYTNNVGKSVWHTNYIQKPAMYDRVKWYQGGGFFEKPEDGLPLYGEMLRNGYVPPELPRVVGWTWEDRKRVPKVTKQFIADLCASTNTAERLNGLLLNLMKTEFHPEDVFHAREQELLDVFWEHRAWILSDASHTAIISETEDILRSKYADSSNQYFDREPFVGFQHRLRKEYLLTATNDDYRTFDELFPSRIYFMPPEQARELVPLLETFSGKTKSRSASNTKQQLERRAGLVTETAKSKPVPVMPAEGTLTAKFIRWDLKPSGVNQGRHVQVRSLVVRGDHLWASVSYLQPNEMFEYDTPGGYVMVNPATGHSEEIPFPEKMGHANGGFDVSDQSLYVSAQNQLQRYSRKEKSWETIPVPMDGAAQPLLLNERLYLATGDGLLEVDPKTHRLQILVSSRRKPALNGVDSLWKPGTRIYARRDGKLGVLLTDRVFSFDPKSRTWGSSPALPKGNVNYLVVSHLSRDGVQLLLTGILGRRHLVGFWNDERMESLVDHDCRRGIADPSLDKELGPSQWDWPAAFDLEAASVFAEGKALNILSPRKVWTGWGALPVSAAFGDNRQGTLMRFEPELRQPLSIPIVFEKGDAGSDPFDPQAGRFPGLWDRVNRDLGDVPFWLNTSAGLVYAVPAEAGHWLITQGALTQRFTTLRATRQNPVPNESSPNRTNNPTNSVEGSNP